MSDNKFDTRQSIQRAALPMVGSAAGDDAKVILDLVDAELGKLFEDRNVVLAGGGDLSWSTGSNSLTMTAALALHVNSRVGGGSPIVISLTAAARAFSANGAMLYAVIDRVAGTATVTADALILPAMVASTQELFVIAKRVGNDLYFRNGHRLEANRTTKLSGPNFYGTMALVDNTLPRTDGTDGKTLQGSGVTLDDSNNAGGFGTLIVGGAAPVASAQLQADSTTKGFLPPRMTGTQRDAIASPAAGLVVFNTSSNTFDYYNGTSWVSLSGTSGVQALEWNLNKSVAVLKRDSYIDGIKDLPNAPGTIIGCAVSGAIMGFSGSTEFELEIADFGSSVWTSIFSVRPQIAFNAGAGVTVYDGTSVPNTVAPVLTSNPLPYNARSKVRLSLPQVQLGAARNFSIKIFYV